MQRLTKNSLRVNKIFLVDQKKGEIDYTIGRPRDWPKPHGRDYFIRTRRLFGTLEYPSQNVAFFEDSTGKFQPSFGKVLAYLQVQFIYTYAHDTVTDCSIVLNSCSWAQIMIHELKVSKSKLVMMRNVLKDSVEDHNGVKVF